MALEPTRDFDDAREVPFTAQAFETEFGAHGADLYHRADAALRARGERQDVKAWRGNVRSAARLAIGDGTATVLVSSLIDGVVYDWADKIIGA